MSWLVALTLLVSALGMVAVQAVMVAVFARRFRRKVTPAATSRHAPPAAVVLCVRGADPSLEHCLQGLARQDYASWQLIVVADSSQDPALELVRRILPDNLGGRLKILTLEPHQRLDHCSLKCSGIVAACGELAPEVEVVAFLDADTLPPAEWLSRLVAPLQNESVGATTALRWYSPVDSHWGTHVRYVWNAAAIVQMWWYRIPWGGSLAIRRALLDQAGLLELWQATFCEDTPLHQALRRAGYEVRYAEGLVLENQESCHLDRVAGWVCRQLLTTRLHHSAWINVLGHAFLTTGLLVGLLISGLLFLIQGKLGLVGTTLGGFVVYQIGMVMLVRWIESGVRGAAQLSGHPIWDLSPSGFRTALDIMVSQAVYPWAAMGAALSRRVEWRKVNYRIGPGKTITRLDYEPFVPDEATECNHSL